MFELAFGEGEEADDEKRKQAANNLIVLAREEAGANRIIASDGIPKLISLLDNSKDKDLQLTALRVLACLANNSRQRVRRRLFERRQLKFKFFLTFYACNIYCHGKCTKMYQASPISYPTRGLYLDLPECLKSLTIITITLIVFPRRLLATHTPNVSRDPENSYTSEMPCFFCVFRFS